MIGNVVTVRWRARLGTGVLMRPLLTIRFTWSIALAATLWSCGGEPGAPSDGDSSSQHGECPPGETLDSSSLELSCLRCSSGEYCAGGTSGPALCSDMDLVDDDEDPSTPCVAARSDAYCEPGFAVVKRECAPCSVGEYCPGGETESTVCAAGQTDDDLDPSTPCAACPVGIFCPAGDAPIVSCGGDTWDHDADPATACADVSVCARNERSLPSDGITDGVCAACPPNLLPTEPNGSDCERFSIDPKKPVPTYTVTIAGAVVAPFDKYGEEWDADSFGSLDVWNQAAIDEVDDIASSGTYEDAVQMVNGYVGQQDIQLPEVYGDARLSVRGFEETRTDLASASDSQQSLLPSWTGSGFAHVPFTDETRILISLYDQDVSTPDAISYVMLTGEDLAVAAEVGDVVALRVWSGSGIIWLTLGLQREELEGTNSAPRSLNAADLLAVEKYKAPSDTKSTLWVHGLDFNGGANVVLPYRSTTYWDDNVSPLRGPSPVAVNYHGQAYVSVSNVVLQYELDSLCRSPESCYIACHSAGCAQTGYALSLHSQLGTRWNVLDVAAAGSAAGGSELAELGAFVGVAGDLARDLKVATMRSLYDHNALGVEVASFCGASGVGLSTVVGSSAYLPGQDDNSVAYHSAGGVVDAAGGPNGSDFGNPADGSAYALPLGYDNRAYLFNGHWVAFRDDEEVLNHNDVKALLAQHMKSYE